MTLILVTSLESHARDKALEALLHSRPEAAVVRHDLLEGDRVLRRVARGAEGVERMEIPLAHGCLTCTVRLDVVPTVMRILHDYSGDVIVGLPPSVSAEMALEFLEPQLALRGVVVESVCLAVDPAALEDQMWDSRTLWQAGLSSVQDDDRTSGEFLVKEIAFSDSALTVEGLFAHLFEAQSPGCQSGGDFFARGTQLLHQLGPHLAVLHPDGEPRLASYQPTAARRRATPGTVWVKGTAAPAPGAGVLGSMRVFGTLELRAERPLHPGRFRAALQEMAAGCIWLRGTLWIANTPGTKMVLGGAGPLVWVEGRGAWNTQTACTHIALTSDDNDEVTLAGLLKSCELTDEEMLGSPGGFEDALRIGDLG